MTAVGIGRGRGWSKNTQDASLRRPGQLPGQKDIQIELIRNSDKKYVAFRHDPSNPLVEIFLNQNISKEQAEKSFEKFYNEALEDREFGRKLIMISEYTSVSRAVYLALFQHDYERREEFWKENPTKFSNYVYLFCHYFHCNRGGQGFRFLIPALINCLHMLLESASEDDIELVMSQISTHGQSWHALCAPLESLMIQVRKVLVSKNLSAKSRGMLLLMVDWESNKYQPLSGELQKFYFEQLGQHSLITDNLKSSSSQSRRLNTKNNISPSPIQGDELSQPSNEISEKLSVAIANHIQLDTNDEKTASKLPSSNSARPRAIRGSGVNENKDKKLVAKKDKSSDAQWSNWNDGVKQKSWGHDDRFDKDY